MTKKQLLTLLATMAALAALYAGFLLVGQTPDPVAVEENVSADTGPHQPLHQPITIEPVTAPPNDSTTGKPALNAKPGQQPRMEGVKEKEQRILIGYITTLYSQAYPDQRANTFLERLKPYAHKDHFAALKKQYASNQGWSRYRKEQRVRVAQVLQIQPVDQDSFMVDYQWAETSGDADPLWQNQTRILTLDRTTRQVTKIEKLSQGPRMSNNVAPTTAPAEDKYEH